MGGTLSLGLVPHNTLAKHHQNEALTNRLNTFFIVICTSLCCYYCCNYYCMYS